MMMNSPEYHQAVMLNEAVEALINNQDGTYVDVTFGGGGHTKLILKKLTTRGSLIAFDQDKNANQNIPHDERFTLINQNFTHISNFLRLHKIQKVDGILADLGVSSHQFNTPERGFSFRYDAQLDMRMNKESSISAKEIINNYSEEELYRILKKYAELKRVKKLVDEILLVRSQKTINTTFELVEILKKTEGIERGVKYYAKVFQALRIETNKEMEVLEKFLLQTANLLKEEGRLVVISYHSLEDRLVKNYIKTGNTEGNLQKDFFGNVIRPLREINKKPIIPSPEEIETNNRARSAKMRVAIKN